jgi:tRNA(Ile)-lysidine synthase
MSLPFIVGEGAAADYAQENKLSIEEAARDLRYRFIFEQATEFGAQAVAVGHNADDQVETVLMHLLRGTGLDGMAGMSYHSLPNPWSDRISLVRPLLGIRRSEIESYCFENQLAPVLDQSNADTSFFRNRLRHDLIPELEKYIPGVTERLWRTANLIAADRALLDDLTENAWQEICIDSGPSYVIINQESLNLQSVALGRRLIRRVVYTLRPGARDLDYALVQRALDFAARPTVTGQADLGLNLRISLEGGQLIISDCHIELPTDYWPQINDGISLTIPGEVEVGTGWILRAEFPVDREVADSADYDNSNPYMVWITLGKGQTLLNVRSRRSGDRFQPLGMNGKSMKISDFMINEKIPRRARDGWPLVCVDDKIIWVPGFRLGHTSQIKDNAGRIIILSLQPIQAKS